MGDFLSHSSARRDWILKRGSPHCSFNDHRSFSRLCLFCIDAILIGISWWWNRDSFWMIQGVIFKCSKRNSEWYIFFGEKKRRIEWKSKEISIESSRFSVNQHGKWMIDTTRYHSDLSRSEQLGERRIEFPSNRMGADRALRETMEKMAISQTNGTGRKEGRYLRSGSGNCQVQEWNWNGDRWDAIGIRSGLAAVSGSSPG